MPQTDPSHPEPSLFKKYDIRGRAMGDNAPLTPPVALQVGRAFARFLMERGIRQVVVGQDNRLSSPALTDSLIEGLRAGGCNVVNLGLVSTPVVNWAAAQMGTPTGAVMVTGSHLEPDQNGFKLAADGKSLYGDDIQALLRYIGGADARSATPGQLVDDLNVIAHYQADITTRARPLPPGGRPLRVVVDAGSGTAGLIAPALLGMMGHDAADCLYCEPDGTYPFHPADPGVEANLRDLAARVIEVKSDVGLAFDGDADRVGVVDERGRIIPPDRVLALLARDLLSRRPGAIVIGDVGCSQVLFDQIAAAGGVPLMWNTGHSLIKAKMRETGALLAGEVSGHLFFAEDYYGFDDAYLAAARLLSLVARAGVPLSALDDAMPRLVATPTYRPHCPRPIAEAAIARIAADWAHLAEVSTVDGLRMQFPEGWGGVRASNTEPVLSMRFEGVDEAAVHTLKTRFVQSLRHFPEIDTAVLEAG